MSAKSTLYALIAAIAATTASGILYAAAKWRLAAIRDRGEGSAEEISSAFSLSNISLLLLAITGVVTVILIYRFVTLKSREAPWVPD